MLNIKITTKRKNMEEEMPIEELIEAVKRTVVNDWQIADLENRLARAEQGFEEDSRRQIVGEDFLSRAYHL